MLPMSLAHTRLTRRSIRIGKSVVLSSTSNLNQISTRRGFCVTSKSSLPIPLSSHFVPTLKAGSTSSTPTPSSTSQSPDVLSSYLLLLRAGFIRQSSSGIFTLLPNAIRILEKIERIVDEEMRGIGASKIQMPTLLSSRLWRKTGRFETMGSELYRLKDRKGSEYVLGPTHEEEVTKLVADEVESWKSLPVKVYQISQKHRDEPRPRSGLLRTKSFLMKDLYTFDASLEEAERTYEQVRSAYSRILKKILGSGKGAWKVAEADSGSIGGKRSHEYHLEDSAGEDLVISCSNSNCDYSANLERAVSLPHKNSIDPDSATPTDWEDLSIRLFSRSKVEVEGKKESTETGFRTGEEMQDDTLTVVLSPRKRGLNHIKLFKSLEDLDLDSKENDSGSSSNSSRGPFQELPLAPTSQDSKSDHSKSSASWDWKERPEGPLVRFNRLRILADWECSALEESEIFEAVRVRLLHFSSSSSSTSEDQSSSRSPSEIEPQLWDFFPQQFQLNETPSSSASTSTSFSTTTSSSSTPVNFSDLRQVSPGDSCSSCRSGLLNSTKAIEIGHTFLLGTKYSEALGVGFTTNEEVDGISKSITKPFQMGCYGLGITRLLGSLAQKGEVEFDKAQKRSKKKELETQSSKTAEGGKQTKKKEIERKGLIWPKGLSPFTALIVPTFPLSIKKEEAILKLELLLNNGLMIPKAFSSSNNSSLVEKDEDEDDYDFSPVEMLKVSENDIALDDRPNLSFGQKLMDYELIGYEHLFVIGNHFEKEGEIEWRSWRRIKEGDEGEGVYEQRKVFIKI